VSAAALSGQAVRARRRRGEHRRHTGKPAGSALKTRLAACVVAVALSAAAVRENLRFRIFEAWLSGHVIGLVTSARAGAVPGAPVVWFTLSPYRDIAMFITPECTVATLIIPFLAGTVLIVWHQSRIARPAAALAVAAVLLVAVNQLRLLTISSLVLAMGAGSGFYWGHTIVGSLITVFGVAFVFCTYILTAVGRRAACRPRSPNTRGMLPR
jgi:exosortase/archaeosortase family protein